LNVGAEQRANLHGEAFAAVTPSPLNIVFAVVFGLVSLVFLFLAAITRRYLGQNPALGAWLAFCLCAVGFTASMAVLAIVPPDRGGELAARVVITFAVTGDLSLLVFAGALGGAPRLVRLIDRIGGGWLVIMVALIWLTDLVVAGARPVAVWSAYPVPGPGIPLFLAYVVYCIGLALVVLVRAFHGAVGLQRTQLGYVLAGLLCAVGTGLVAFLPVTVVRE
jgi:hypothetical protein